MTQDEEFDLGAFADLLADPSLWVEPPADLEARVVAAVAAVVAIACVSAPASAVGGHVESATRASRRIRRPLRRFAGPFLVGAAAASLVIGVVLVATREQRPSWDATVALEVGPAAPLGTQPGTVKLRATPSGLRIEVYDTSLPALVDGSVYACWVKTAAGLQTCGAFHTGGDGIVLWSGVRHLDDVQAISITVEPAGDPDPASSGQRALFAKIGP